MRLKFLQILSFILYGIILSACQQTATMQTNVAPPKTAPNQAQATFTLSPTAKNGPTIENTPNPTTSPSTPTPAAETKTPPTPTQTPPPEPSATASLSPQTNAPDLPFDISLPPGFEIKIYADNVPNARSMALGPKGTLFVGTRQAGNLYAVRDNDQDFVADEVITLAQGMFSPNGVAIRKGSLYVAEVNRILRYDDIEATLPNLPQAVVVTANLPAETWHGWKYLRFGPDDKLYFGLGAPCNVCQTDDTGFATINRINPDGSDMEIYARGVRNSIGFDWHPQTQELWFTDNGRDNLGDDLPPDELNRAPEAGLHFGFPYCHGGFIEDPEIEHSRHCDEFSPPAQALGPHVAPLGMRFYTGNMFPAEYHNQIFIAEHGSWNRSVPIGYRISLVQLEGDTVTSYAPFAEGWLRNGQAWGRPVDLLIMPDGSMLVSDDTAGAIYRIAYVGE